MDTIQNINHYALKFVKSKSQYNSNDTQLRVLREYLQNGTYDLFESHLTDDFKDFETVITGLNDGNIIKCHEPVYKNDGMLIRKNTILSAECYIVLTCLTFNIAKEYYVKYPGSRIGKEIFYAGNISFNLETVDIDSRYVTSYNLFRSHLNKFERSTVIKTDCTNFFDSIIIKKLLFELKQLGISDNLVSGLELFFEVLQLEQLPQIPYSTSVSFLSQIYLHNFDKLLTNSLLGKSLGYIRYVDDMYIKLSDFVSKKNQSEIIDIIQGSMVKYGLSISISKTDFLQNQRLSSYLSGDKMR